MVEPCCAATGAASATTDDRYVRRPSRLSCIRVRMARRDSVYMSVSARVIELIFISCHSCALLFLGLDVLPSDVLPTIWLACT